MGYLGQKMAKNSPWATLVIWIVLVVCMASPLLEEDNIWIVLGGCAIAIGFLVLVFFTCRRQARINKKLREQGKSINNVSWTKNMGLHMDEMLDDKKDNDAKDSQ